MTLTDFLLARIAEDEGGVPECEAKRRIVKAQTTGDWRALAIQHLAAVYAHHPDYRDEWRP